MLCVFLLLVMMVTREIAVFRLRVRKRGDWVRLGSPEFLERDVFLKKFPCIGWTEVYGTSGIFDRVVLVAFLLSHVMFVIFSLISLAMFVRAGGFD
jgi:hypothetical protein